MKNFLITLCLLPTIVFSQYSNYYKVDVNSNSNVNVNKNVNVSGYVNKTITSIDYGALAQANALSEKNRLEAQTYSDFKERQQSIEIAENPLKAFDYGIDASYNFRSKVAKQIGLKKFSLYMKVPHQALFKMGNTAYNYRNESENGVITDLEISFYCVSGTTPENEEHKASLNTLLNYQNRTEDYIKEVLMKGLGKYENNSFYVHKEDINKATVCGSQSFVYTMIYEDDYEYVIKDNYYLLHNNMFIQIGARYKGDKDEVTFEMLEGRKFYLKRFVNQFAASGLRLSNIKF